MAEYYDYGVNFSMVAPGSWQWTKVTRGDTQFGPYVKTYVDMLGRKVREERPGRSLSNTAFTHFEYDGDRLTRRWSNSLVFVLGFPFSYYETIAGLGDTLFEYDALGNLVRTCVDVDRDAVVDLAGPDRVTDTDTMYVEKDSAWWLETKTSVYPKSGMSTAVPVSWEREQLTGLGNLTADQDRATKVIAYRESEDIHHNITSSKTELGLQFALLYAVVTVDTSPESTTSQVTATRNGLVLSTTTQTGLTYKYEYDDIGRRIKTIDLRTGAVGGHLQRQRPSR